jgi:hypothetical protein
LNRVDTGTASVNPSLAVPLMRQTQQTLLFPTLVKKIDPGRRLSVLEIGPALPETIDFFSQFKCRLQFAAMYTDPVLQMPTDDMSDKDLAAHYTKAFDFSKGTKFDICLFWDFLNYLDDKSLRAFNTAIQPYCHKTTRAHSFTVRTLETSFPNQQYGIDQAHMFSIRPGLMNQANTYPKTQATLLNLLPCFDIDQGMLLPDGRLEVLMSATP